MGRPGGKLATFIIQSEDMNGDIYWLPAASINKFALRAHSKELMTKHHVDSARPYLARVHRTGGTCRAVEY